MAPLTYSQYVQFIIQYASITLIYYDFVLTFEREVKYIWRKSASIAMVLVIFCQYSLVANVVFALGLVNKLAGRGCVCDFAYIIASSLSMLGRVGILTILGARTCAIFQHNRYVVAFFSMLGLTVMGLAIAHVPFVSCTGNGRKSPKPSPGELLSIFTVVFELLSTLALAYGCIRSAMKTAVPGEFRWDRKGLIFLVFREGLMYTGFVSLFTTGAMILVYTTPPGSFAQRSLNALTLPISGMMTVRFLLHLREWQSRAGLAGTEFHAVNPLTTLQFSDKSENQDGLGKDSLMEEEEDGAIMMISRDTVEKGKGPDIDSEGGLGWGLDAESEPGPGANHAQGSGKIGEASKQSSSGTKV